MLLSLLLVWALVTATSAVALVLFLAFDEWQVRARADAEAQPEAGGQTTVTPTTHHQGSPQTA